jgi:predicted NAD-dependent protein-ADP-ribosyltransferase YbiA (DUF1768 family)
MEEVPYLKFKQHRSCVRALRTLSMRTTIRTGVDDPPSQGANELGKALVRLRERLQQESEN